MMATGHKEVRARTSWQTTELGGADSGRRGRRFCLGTASRSRERRANKKEVKTGSFSPPGVGGVLHDNTLGGSAVLPCQAGLRPHSRTALGNSLGDSPPKSMPLCDFVAPRRARVNGKKGTDR